MSFILHLAFPPTLNHANGLDTRNGRVKYYPSREKVDFIRDSDVLFLRQKRGLQRVAGPFTYHLILNEKERHGNSDGDNRGKACLDYLQRVDLIDNDKLAAGGSWSWGHCEFGAMLSVYPFQPRFREAPHNSGERDPSVMPDCTGADTVNHRVPELQKNDAEKV